MSDSPAVRGSGTAARTVPKDMFDDARDTAEKLKQKLGEVVVSKSLEYEDMMRSLQYQLTTLQGQYRTAEEQLRRSMQREKDLRDQLSNADVSTILGKVRQENKALREEVLRLNRIVETMPGELAKSQDEVSALKEELNAWQHEHSQLVARHESVISGMKEEHQAMQRNLHTLKSSAKAEESKQIRALQEECSRAKDMVETLRAENQEMRSVLQQTRLALAASQESAASLTQREREHEKQGSMLHRLLGDKDAELHAAENRAKTFEERLLSLNSQLEQERSDAKNVARKLHEKELEFNSAVTASRQSHDKQMRENEKMASQIIDLQRKIAFQEQEIHQAELDAQSIREQMREELRKAEAETKQVRDSLRHERDLLERTMRENTMAFNDQLEQRQRAEETAMKREETLQRRVTSLEREIQSLKETSAPESALRSAREDIRLEREQFYLKLKKAADDSKRQEELNSMVISKMERKLFELEDETKKQSECCQDLEKELREARRTIVSDKKQLEYAKEQIRKLSGLSNPGDRNIKIRSSQMAEVGLEILQNAYNSSQDAALKAQSTADSSDDITLEHRASVGLILTENIVDYIMLSSPADTCGLIEKGDEILVVDGQRVSSSSAAAALRGGDLVGGCVEISLRKAANGEIVQIRLPKLGAGFVKKKQQMSEAFNQHYTDALQAARNDNHVLLERSLECLKDISLSLDRQQLGVLQSLTAHTSALSRAVRDLHTKAIDIISEIDSSHQQVHALQQLTESELRDLLTVDWDETKDRSSKESLHSHIQELEQDLKALQEELSATVMLKRDASEEAAHYKAKAAQVEEALRFFEEGQIRMRRNIQELEDRLTDVTVDGMEYPYIVGLTLDCDYDSTVRDSTARAEMVSSMRDDISLTLRVPKNSVQVMCLHRGSVKAVIKLSGVAASSSLQRGMQTGKMLADNLVKGFAEPSSSLHEGAYTRLVRDAEVFGPISESAAAAFKASLSDREKDHRWLEEELERAHRTALELESHYSADIEFLTKQNEDRAQELEAQTQDVADSLSISLQEAHRKQLERISEEYRSTQLQMKAEHQSEINSIKNAFIDHKNLLEALARTKGIENSVLQDTNREFEVAVTSLQEEAERLREQNQNKNSKLNKCRETSEKIERMVVSELKSCLTTLNNVESEMGFFYAYHMRVVAISAVAEVSDPQLLQDIKNSKEMMHKDIAVLRSQLEQLASFNYAESIEVGEMLADTSQRQTPIAGVIAPHRAPSLCNGHDDYYDAGLQNNGTTFQESLNMKRDRDERTSTIADASRKSIGSPPLRTSSPASPPGRASPLNSLMSVPAPSSSETELSLPRWQRNAAAATGFGKHQSGVEGVPIPLEALGAGMHHESSAKPPITWTATEQSRNQLLRSESAGSKLSQSMSFVGDPTHHGAIYAPIGDEAGAEEWRLPQFTTGLHYAGERHSEKEHDFDVTQGSAGGMVRSIDGSYVC